MEYITLTGVVPVKKILDKIEGSSYDKLSDEIKIPYTFNVTRYLYWLGVDIEGMEYSRENYTPPLVEGKYPLMAHQIDTIAKMTTWGYGFNLSLPRTGKTAASIASLDFLRAQKAISSALIVTPLSTVYSVWEKEIRGMLPDASIAVMHSKKYTKKAKSDYFASLISENMDYYIINPAGLLHKDVILDGNFKAIVVDESTEFGNQTTKNWKALNKIKDGIPYLWLLTGTPGSPMTVHGQIRLLKPDAVPSNKRTWQMQTMFSPREHVWIPKPESVELIRELMRPALRYTREQVLKDCPKELIFGLEIPLGDKSKLLYNKLLEDSLVEIVKGGETIELGAANVGVLVNRLVQISSGVVKIDDKELMLEDSIAPKMDEVIRLIDESEGKFIIVVGFTAVNKEITKRLLKAGYNVESVTGSTSAKKRGEIFTDFMSGDIQVLVAHPTVIKFGVELASASDLAFWSVPFIAPLAYKQVKDRIYSGKQKSKFPTVHQLYSTSLEKRMFSNLEKNLEWQTDLADYFIKLD